jgi:GNAT superfamily N-acetyltransferase
MSRFNLPVFKPAHAATGDELLHRAMHAEEVYDRTLGESFPLDYGIAICSPELPEVDMANEIRDASVPADMTAAQVVADAEALFARQGCPCLAWSFASLKIDEPLAAILEPRGFRRHRADAMAMHHPQIDPTRLRTDLSIIPARASFRGIRELLHAVGDAIARSSPPPSSPGTAVPGRALQFAEAAVSVLDDPRIEGLLALKDTTPVGLIYLVTVAEMGFIADLYIHPDHRRQRIATTLLDRTLELAARSRLRQLTLFCRPDNAPAQALYTQTGFAHIGTIETLRRQ